EVTAYNPNIVKRGVLLLVLLAGCRRADDLVIPEGSMARLVQDSPEVRRMLARQHELAAETQKFWSAKHTQEEIRQRLNDQGGKPDQYNTIRDEVIAAMSSQPAINVAGR